MNRFAKAAGNFRAIFWIYISFILLNLFSNLNELVFRELAVGISILSLLIVLLITQYVQIKALQGLSTHPKWLQRADSALFWARLHIILLFGLILAQLMLTERSLFVISIVLLVILGLLITVGGLVLMLRLSQMSGILGAVLRTPDLSRSARNVIRIFWLFVKSFFGMLVAFLFIGAIAVLLDAPAILLLCALLCFMFSILSLYLTIIFLILLWSTANALQDAARHRR